MTQKKNDTGALDLMGIILKGFYRVFQLLIISIFVTGTGLEYLLGGWNYLMKLLIKLMDNEK